VRILIAIGGLPYSELALRYGARIAAHVGQTPTLLTVVRHPREQRAAEELMIRARGLLAGVAPEVRTRIRAGHPAEEIVREAEEGAYNLVVVGDRQHPQLVTRFLLGSTAERVVEHAPCPVVIAKGKVGSVDRILLCDSGVEDPSLLARFTSQVAGLITGREEITILHVMSQISAAPGLPGEGLSADAEELIRARAPEGLFLQRDLRILEALDVRAQPKVRHGLVVEEILDEAGCGNYDLVVIGAHRGDRWRRILLDDLSHQVITRADRPVLVVR
jgi:nucleotide-binding universal stress UspA family protein